jgi:hypothetical protein
MKTILALIKEILFVKEILGAIFHKEANENALPKNFKHTIIVYPGFLTGNFSTIMMRRYLKSFGHNVFGWEGGINSGYCRKVDQALEDQFLKISSENEKVVLIGWSLGGIYARELARKYPKKVLKVIAIGSPFGNIMKGTNIRWLYMFISGKKIRDLHPTLLKKLSKPLAVPFISIYSRQDGVVDFRACIQKGISAHPYFHIEVRGTHLGLPFNLEVFKQITISLNGIPVKQNRFEAALKRLELVK